MDDKVNAPLKRPRSPVGDDAATGGRHGCANEGYISEAKTGAAEGRPGNIADRAAKKPDAWGFGLPPFVDEYLPYTGQQLLQWRRRRRYADVQQTNWNLYYRNNRVNGYKDRHYILREFHELRHALHAGGPPDAAATTNASNSCQDSSLNEKGSSSSDNVHNEQGPIVWIEIGCGVGNAVLPVLRGYNTDSTNTDNTDTDSTGTISKGDACDEGSVTAGISSLDVPGSNNGTGHARRAVLDYVGQDRSKRRSRIRVCGFDISTTAVQLLQEAVVKEGHQADVFVIAHDLAKEAVPASFLAGIQPLFYHAAPPAEGATGAPSLLPHFASLIFVLSAIMPEDLDAFVSRAAALLRPGGVLFFRDYYENDMAQRRFQQQPAAGDRYVAAQTFVRSNGTLSHFFKEQEVRDLFGRHDLKTLDVQVIEREIVNRKEDNLMARKWIQGRFIKL